MATHHLGKFVGPKQCSSGDIIILVCHVKGPCDFIGRSPSR